MEDDAESVDLMQKVQEMHIIQIFGFDGKTSSISREFFDFLKTFHRQDPDEGPF